MQWEYAFREQNADYRDINELDEMGKNDWELVTQCYVASNNTILFTFKKPLTFCNEYEEEEYEGYDDDDEESEEEEYGEYDGYGEEEEESEEEECEICNYDEYCPHYNN